jgi:hypothetical protein
VKRGINEHHALGSGGTRTDPTPAANLCPKLSTPMILSITRPFRPAMDNLTPSDLFSPSKARQQRAQAQDWAHIDTWLQYKYSGRTIPTFERNDETLKVLRELSMANERADEERTIQERLEREALKELDEVWLSEGGAAEA